MSNLKPPKRWPSDGSVVDITSLTDPVLSSIRSAYKLRLFNILDIPWTGLTLGARELAICSDPQITLTKERLLQSSHSALETIVGIAVQLGIEQGRRLRNAENKLAILAARAALDLIQGELQ